MINLGAKRIQYVNSGEVRSAGKNTILNSGAIGSCVVITAFDFEKKIGAMAHIMLPDTFLTKNRLQDTRYATHAIEEMFKQLKNNKSTCGNLDFCIVGGANVLKRENDSIGKDNIESVERLLLERHVLIKARSTGGFERRTVLFDIENGCIYLTVGDSKQEILWQKASKEL